MRFFFLMLITIIILKSKKMELRPLWFRPTITLPIAADFDTDRMLVKMESTTYAWAVNRKTKHAIGPIRFRLLCVFINYYLPTCREGNVRIRYFRYNIICNIYLSNVRSGTYFVMVNVSFISSWPNRTTCILP